MLIRITREMVRHAAKAVCPFIDTANGGIKGNEYCHTCIISDALYNLIPNDLKPYHTIETVGGQRIELISRITGKRSKIKGDSVTADAIIKTFDKIMLDKKRQPIDNVYNELKSAGLLKVELDDPRPLLDNVQVVYKTFCGNMMSCLGGGSHAYDMQYSTDEWHFPSKPNSKLFCVDTLHNARRLCFSQVYKCLALNPVAAKAQAANCYQITVPLFWSKYSPEKEPEAYGKAGSSWYNDEVAEKPASGTMFADAIKLLEPA